MSAKVNDELVPEAEAVLDRHHAVDPARRGAEYRERGWSSFDGDAEPYNDDQIREERARYVQDRIQP